MEDSVGVSEEEREMLRHSVRGLLEAKWPVEGAVERSAEAKAILDIWADCAKQGLSALGADPQEAGLSEIMLVFDELGRASCPAPLLGAISANLLLAGSASANQAASEMLDGLHQGSASPAIVLAAFDGDAAAGRVEYGNGVLSGRVQFVEGAGLATHFVVLSDDPAGAAIVPADASGLEITPTPGLAVPSLSEITLSATPASLIELPASRLAEIAEINRMACVARALGAASRAFDLALEHTTLRSQFGKLIGQFQAIQHKLADCLVRLDGSRLLIESAAQTHDRGDPSWVVFASTALAYASPALRQVILEAHHTLGAIGYAEEHEAPRHFRRVHADLVRFGGAGRARAQLAEHLLGPIGQ